MNIFLKEMNTRINLCYLCSIKAEDFLEISNYNGRKLQIAEIVSQHLIFKKQKIDAEDIICKQCWCRLSDFHQFYVRIEKVHERLEMEIVKNESHPIEKSFDMVPEDNQLENWSTQSNSDNEHIKREPEIEMDDGLASKRINGNKNVKHPTYQTIFNMDCELCNERFITFSQICNHYQTVHNEKGFLTCCGKKFYTRRSVRYHMASHVQPKSLTCDYCQKEFHMKCKLRDHLLTHVDPAHRPYRCDRCDRTFVKKYKLIQHQRVRHPDENEKVFGCDQCDKRFVVKYLLQSHITQSHGAKDSFICDVCARGFSIHGNYVAHKKLVHDRLLPPVQCKICAVWVSNRNNLKTHMIIHTDTEQTCKFCFKILKNRRSLRTHCSVVHSQRKFICHICSKIFQRALNLQEHMASHTGAVLYSCKFCSKPFNSSANMYKHRKAAHPYEYKLMREEESSGPKRTAGKVKSNTN